MALALITGAGSGIGFATAVELARKGWSLILTGRRQDRLLKLQAELRAVAVQKTQEFQIAAFDIQSAKACEKFVNDFSASLSGLDVLINNAGLAKGTERLQEAVISDLDQMIDTNVKGLLYLTRGVLPHMIKRQQGHIVNLGSVAGRWLYPGGAVYCASKFAVRALTEGLRMDLLGTPIRVSNVEPGMVETEFSIVRLGSEEKAKKVYAGMNALTPKDIAETITWILERPKHVNIQELVIYPTDQAHVGMVHRSTT